MPNSSRPLGLFTPKTKHNHGGTLFALRPRQYAAPCPLRNSKNRQLYLPLHLYLAKVPPPTRNCNLPRKSSLRKRRMSKLKVSRVGFEAVKAKTRQRQTDYATTSQRT